MTEKEKQEINAVALKAIAGTARTVIYKIGKMEAQDDTPEANND